MTASPRDAWTKANREILDKLDVLAEYRSFGVDVTVDEPGHSGWMACRAFGREDKSASAQINVGGDHPQRGRYKEFVGDSRNLSLFEFAAMAKPTDFEDWKKARNHYAKQTGVKLPKGGPPKAPEDSLEFADYNDSLINVWCRQHKPGIIPAAVKVAGCRLAAWSKQQVIAIPAYGSHLLDMGPIGWQIWPLSGCLRVFQGKGKPPVQRKISTVTGSKAGWMNEWALRHLDGAEIVWKVEGPSDMLALQSIIPRKLIKSHVVVANSGGSLQIPTAELIAPLAGKTVYVVHDCDEDGQTGALRWVKAITAVAADCRNVVLPYPVVEMHGRDLRDWILDEIKAEMQLPEIYLRALKRAVTAPATEPKPAIPSAIPSSETPLEAAPPPPSTAASGDMSAEKIIAEALGIDVVDRTDSGDVEIYNWKTNGHFIRSPSRANYEDLLQICGVVGREKIHQAATPVENQYHISVVKQALAVLSSQPQPKGGRVGRGCWLGVDCQRQPDGTVVLVGAGEAAIWDGKVLRRVYRPRFGELLMEIWNADPWYCFDAMEKNLRAAADKTWCEKVVDVLIDWFSRWNWGSANSPTAMAGMVLATWVQSTWEWRPQIAITGASNSGKSLMFKMLKQIFSGLELLSSQSSAPGIRQAVGHSSCVILLDEFDSMRATDREAMLAMFRNSGRGDRVLKGTTSQKGIDFELRHIAWLGGLNVDLRRAPDQNRFLRHELLKAKPGEHGKLKIPSVAECRDLGQRLLAIAVRHCGRARGLADEMRAKPYRGLDMRIIESYSVPAALLAAMMDVDAGSVHFHQTLLDCVPRSGEINDEMDLLEAILAASTTTKEHGQRAVGQLLQQILSTITGDEKAEAALENVGVRVGKFTIGNARESGPRGQQQHDLSGRPCLILAQQSIRNQLLKGGDWQGQSVEQILGRLPNALTTRRRVGGAVQDVVLLDLAWVRRQFLDDDEDDENETKGKEGEF